MAPGTLHVLSEGNKGAVDGAGAAGGTVEGDHSDCPPAVVADVDPTVVVLLVVVRPVEVARSMGAVESTDNIRGPESLLALEVAASVIVAEVVQEVSQSGVAPV